MEDHIMRLLVVALALFCGWRFVGRRMLADARAAKGWEKISSKLLKINRCPHPRASLSRSKQGSNQHQTRYVCRRCAQKVYLPIGATETATPKLVSLRYGEDAVSEF